MSPHHIPLPMFQCNDVAIFIWESIIYEKSFPLWKSTTIVAIFIKLVAFYTSYSAPEQIGRSYTYLMADCAKNIYMFMEYIVSYTSVWQ